MSSVALIEAFAIRLPFRDRLVTSRTAYVFHAGILVRVESDDGAVGWGETRASPHITGETQAGIVETIETRLAPALIGIDPFDLSGAHVRMARAISFNSSAKSALDIALHDLAGQLAGVPVANLLGGTPGGPIASSKAVSVGAVEAMTREARRYVAAGFSTLKIKTGVDWGAELSAIAAIRVEVGPRIALKLDANQGWDLAEATRFLEAAAAHDIEMVEQPLPAWDLAGHAALRRRTPIPVMLDEGVHGPRDALRAIEADACDHINIKLLKTGGLAPARDLAAICAAGGIGCQIGTLDTSIGSAAAVHLVHACPVIRFAEINGPSRLDQDIASGFTNRDGMAILQPGPGLGVTMDTGAVEGARR